MTKTNPIEIKKSGRSSLRLMFTTALIVTAIATEALVLTACASAPLPPTQALQAAELAIKNAEQARVADYASPELAEARQKLVASRLAVEKKDMVTAQRYAEQAKVDADLATSKAAVAKAKAVNDEMQKSTSTLQQEMQRNPGVK